MSRIGRRIINLPENIQISVVDNTVIVKGPKGELNFKVPTYQLQIIINDQIIEVKRKSEDKQTKAMHGLTRVMIANMINGVSNGFEKKLEIKGVGYRVNLDGDKLNFALGFSHPVIFSAPKGISFKVEKNIITVMGIDKQLVGQVAAKIKAIRPPDAYKGKGVRYYGEKIKLKPGKTAKAGAK